MDNYDLLSPEQLRMASRRMRTELDNLYKAGAKALCSPSVSHSQAVHNLRHAYVLSWSCKLWLPLEPPLYKSAPQLRSAVSPGSAS